MPEQREDTPDPPTNGISTGAGDNPWLPPELRRAEPDRQADEPPPPDPEEGFGEPPPPAAKESIGAPPPPAVQETFGAPPPPAEEDSFGAPPSSHPAVSQPPVSQPPVTDPAGPLPAPTPKRRRIRWPRIRKPSLPSRSRPRPRPGAKPRGVAVAIVAIILVGGAGFAIGAASKSEKSDSSPTAIYRQLMTTFTVDRARFEVQPANDKGWAEEMRRTEGGQEGKRWVATAVAVRNLGRASVRPRSLGYRIVTPSGFVIGPEVIEIDRTVFEPGGLLAKGGRTSVHLGFRVPVDARDLTLAFEASGIRQPAVRVLLGAEG